MAFKTQSGFSAVLSIIAIVIVIGVAGLIGWRLYSQSHPSNVDATSTNHNTSQSPINSTNQTTSSAQPADPNAGYFVIKEWGVRFKLPADLSGLEYKMTNFSDDPSDSYADFYTSQLVSLVPECNPLAGSWSVGLIRLARYPISNEQPITGFSGRITSLGGYNYYYGANQAVCPDDQTIKDTAASIRLLQTDSIELINAVKSLEVAQPTILDIKELGIKLTLNSSILDAVYAPFDNTSSDVTQAIGISALSITDKDSSCIASKGPLGVIIETTKQPTYVGGQQLLPVDNQSLFKFGNNYFMYMRPQAQGCLSTDQADVNLLSDKINAFAQSFVTTQSDN